MGFGEGSRARCGPLAAWRGSSALRPSVYIDGARPGRDAPLGIAAIATTGGRALDDAGRIQAGAPYIRQDNEATHRGHLIPVRKRRGPIFDPLRSIRYIYSYGF